MLTFVIANFDLMTTLKQLLFLLLLLPLVSHAQSDSIFITGKVYDYETQKPLKNAVFKHNGELIKLTDNGDFQCYVKTGDTLAFRYVGHKDYEIIIDNDLEKTAYISGVFLNKEDLISSKHILQPRLNNAKSFASYDPLEMERNMKNAQHTLSIAAYQAGQDREWDVSDNQKYAMNQKEMDIEYKAAIKPSSQVGLGLKTNLLTPLSSITLEKQGLRELPQIKRLTKDEEFYVITLFKALINDID